MVQLSTILLDQSPALPRSSVVLDHPTVQHKLDFLYIPGACVCASVALVLLDVSEHFAMLATVFSVSLDSMLFF